MKVSKLIQKLEKLKSKHGDIQVYIDAPYYEYERLQLKGINYIPKGVNGNSLIEETEKRIVLSPS